jgi:hypothetical protein
MMGPVMALPLQEGPSLQSLMKPGNEGIAVFSGGKDFERL